MVKQKAEERRQGIRAKRILSIQFRLVEGKGKTNNKTWHLSTTQDMSFIGLSFLSDISLSVGDTLEVRVVMSGVLDIYAGLAKVVRSEKKKTGAFYVVGVKFIDGKIKTRKAKAFSKKTAKSRIKK